MTNSMIRKSGRVGGLAMLLAVGGLSAAAMADAAAQRHELGMKVNASKQQPATALSFGGSYYFNTDSDGDGFSDEIEAYSVPGSDPFDWTDTPLSPRDSDGDGCSDYDEITWGFCDSNAYSWGSDSDFDGFSDETEIYGVPGSDPFDASDTPLYPRDSDGDGCSDYDEREWDFCDGNPFTSGPVIEVGPGCGPIGFLMLGASLLGMVSMRSSRRLRF